MIKINKKMLVLGIAIVIIIMLRCIFDTNENLVYIVAGINIVAMAFVVYTAVEKAVDCITIKIEESHVPEQIVKREIKSAQSKIWGLSILAGITGIVLYFLFGCSNRGNDIISILALGISVQDDDIVKAVAEKYKI